MKKFKSYSQFLGAIIFALVFIVACQPTPEPANTPVATLNASTETSVTPAGSSDAPTNTVPSSTLSSEDTLTPGNLDVTGSAVEEDGEDENIVPPPAADTPTATAASCQPPAGWVIYIVRPSDTFFALGLATNQTVEELLEANCTRDVSLLAGQELYLPFIPTPPSAPATDTRIPTILPDASPDTETPTLAASATLPPPATDTSTSTAIPTPPPTDTPGVTLTATIPRPSTDTPTPTLAVTGVPVIVTPESSP
ncbi:MAG: hypothetical protein ACI9EW_002790 [Cellvibrionaceae bacterium]|jgi:hypothetical protein